MRFRIAPVFIHASPRSGQPSGVWRPKIGWPRRATICAVRGVGRARVHGAKRAGHDLERRLHLGAIRRTAEELGQRDDAAQRLANVAVGLAERARAAIDQRFRRIVAHEMASQLGHDEVGGGRARATMSSRRSPSSSPRPAENFWPRIVFSPASWMTD